MNGPYSTSNFFILLFNTFTANYEYSCSNTENLPLPIEIQLSEKPKTFCQFSIAFLESTSHFDHFETKSEPYSLSISEVTYPERRAHLNAGKVLFLQTFGNERVKT